MTSSHVTEHGNGRVRFLKGLEEMQQEQQQALDGIHDGQLLSARMSPIAQTVFTMLIVILVAQFTPFSLFDFFDVF